MYIWLVSCGSIPWLIFLSLQTRHCRSRLKTKYLTRTYLTRLLWKYLLIDYFFHFKEKRTKYTCISGKFVVALSLDWYFLSLWITPYCRSRLKNELYMRIWLAVFCGSIPSLIDIFFRFKRVISSLTIKQRGKLSLDWYFLSLWMTLYCRSRLKNELYMRIWLAVCCGSIPWLIFSFALNASYRRSRLKNEVYMYHDLACLLRQYPSIDVLSFALTRNIVAHA